MNLLRVSWRNLWRNRRRTAITMAAVCINTMILITSYCLIDGLLAQTVRNATQVATGEAQLHAPGYLPDRSLYKTLEDSGALLSALGRESIGAAPRVFGYGLVSQGTKAAGALFRGIDPAMERASFDLPGHLAEGTFLGSVPRKTLVLGKKLAKSLDARVGSEIVVLVQATDGSMGKRSFHRFGEFSGRREKAWTEARPSCISMISGSFSSCRRASTKSP